MVVCELFSYESLCDIPNWLTMTIELIIGGIVGSVFFLKQAQQGRKLQTVIDENEKIKQQQKNYAIESASLFLQVIYLNSEQIIYLFDIPKNNWAPQQHYMYNQLNDLVQKYVAELELLITRYSNVLDVKLISEISDLMDFFKDNETIKQESYYQNIKKHTVEILNQVGTNKYKWKK